MKSVPQCNGSFSDNCPYYITESIVERDILIPDKINSGMFNMKNSDDNGFMMDSTSRKKMPMRYKIITRHNKDIIYSYQFKGKYGKLSLNSDSIQKNLVSNNPPNDGNLKTDQVVDSSKLLRMNKGFGVDSENRAVDENDQLIIPPCEETKMFIDDKGKTTVQCIYGDKNHKDGVLILRNKYDITHDIDLSKCTIWGGSFSGKKVEDVLKLNNRFEISSRKDGVIVPPVFLFCKKYLRKNYKK